MRFNLEFHLNIDGKGTITKGEFTSRKKSDIPEVAYQYIRSIKRETGYRKMKIEKVMVNSTEDITIQVREIENRPLAELDDVFW